MESLFEEVASIRCVHADLQTRLARLNHRIVTVEAALAAGNTKPAPETSTKPRAFENYSPEPGTPAPKERKPAPPPLPVASPAETSLPSPKKDSLEIRFGQVWLVRIGIVILLTGLVFLGNFAYQEFIGRLGAGGKLALLFLAGSALTLTGWRLQRRDSLRNFARVLIGGGLATFYYSAFAAHFVPTLRVIESPVLAGALLLGLGGAFVALADRLKSGPLATTAIILSFYTSAINPVGGFSLFSNLVISLASLALLVRHGWMTTSFLTLVGTYGTFAFWRIHNAGSLVQTPEATFLPTILFPVAYWLVHTAAVLWRRTPTFDPAARSVYLTANNSALFALVAPAVEFRHPGSLWLVALGFGATLIGLAVAAARRNPEERLFDGSYLAQGLGLLFLAMILKFTGWAQPVSFALLTGLLINASRLRHGGMLRLFAVGAAMIATLSGLADLVENANAARTVAAACAGIFVVNAWLLRWRKSLLQQIPVDFEVLSHVGLAFMLTLAATLRLPLAGPATQLLVIGTIAALSLRLIRLPELVYAGQLLILCGQLALVACALDDDFHLVPSMTAAAVFTVWWQRRTPIAPVLSRLWQTLHVLGPVVIGFALINLHCPFEWRSTALAGMGLGLIAVAFVSRAWPLAIYGAIHTLAALGFSASAIAHHSSWLPIAWTLGTIHLQAITVSVLGFRAPVSAAGSLIRVCQIARSAVTAFAVWLFLTHAPAPLWFLGLAGTGCAVFSAGSWIRSRETTCHGLALIILGIVAWLLDATFRPAEIFDVIPLALLAASQRLARHCEDFLTWLPRGTNDLSIAVISSSLWFLAHRLLATTQSGFLITIAWSLLAFAILGAGFLWRERAYRFAGLAILVAAIVRVFAVDVWSLETIYRILSFLVLGVVLIVLSFLYNRNAEALKKWL